VNITTIEKLSPVAITCEPIRHAVEQLGVATEHHDEKRRDLVELEQTREAAEWADAEALDAARVAGKPAPRRTHVAAHDKRTEEARVEFKAAQIAIERARKELAAVIDEHGEAFAAEVRQAATEAIETWRSKVEELPAAHAEVVEALRVCRQFGGDWPVYEWVALKPKQLTDGPIPLGATIPTVKIVAAGDHIAALMELGQPKQPQEPGWHPLDALRSLKNYNQHAGQGGWEREKREREEEDALLAAHPPRKAPSTVDGVTATVITPAELAAARADLAGEDD
jgi:hypothetical protein